MRKILLSLLFATLGLTAAQDVGRAASPSVDALRPAVEVEPVPMYDMSGRIVAWEDAAE